MRRPLSLGIVSLAFSMSACGRSAPPPAYPQGPGYPPPPHGAPPGAYPGAYPAPYPGAPPGYPAPAAPGQPPSAPAASWPAPTMPPPAGGVAPMPPAPPSQPGAAGPVYGDPLNALDIGFMRQRAGSVLAELRAALPQQQASQMAGVPLLFDETPGDVNAFAACTENGPLMAITDGLLEISAQMARSKATDEFFGTSKLRDYMALVSREQQRNQPIVRPAPGFFEQHQDVDGRKVARQHDLFDEQVAFILGHELAHHYLQHTGCVGASGGLFNPAAIGRVLSNAVEVFNQPNELASDTNGVTNLLNAGRARAGTKWTEEGAMMTLQFFAALMQMDPADRLLFAFQASHPPPELRVPVVQNAAQQWRATGGASTSPLPLPLPLPIPFPFPFSG